MKVKETTFSYSPLESDRFGYKIYRATAAKICLSEIQNTFKNEVADILILRFPTSKITQLQELSAQGISYILADTFVTLGNKNIENQEVKVCRNKEVTFTLTTSYSQEIENCIREVFTGYKNHYTINPLFDSNKALEGYVEWGLSFLKAEGKQFWKAEVNQKMVGFFTIEIEKNSIFLELGGSINEYRGKGLYRDIVRFSQNIAKENSCFQYYSYTQVDNHTIQNVQQSEGMKMLESYYTIHIFREGLQ